MCAVNECEKSWVGVSVCEVGDFLTCSLPSSLAMTVFRNNRIIEGSFSKWDVSSVTSMGHSK